MSSPRVPLARLTSARVSPQAFRRLTTAVLVASGLIVVTGAAVRLTGSGLGCPTWPNCRSGQLDATGLGLKGAIEFGNRVMTVAITVLVGVTAVASLLLPVRRTDLRRLAWGLVAGIVGDAIIGGITVLTHLDPAWVAVHFLFSMGILVAAATLHRRSGWAGSERRPDPSGATDRLVRMLARGIVALAAFVLAAGTLTTGSGPHAGDARARRFDLGPLDRVTALHADSAMLLTGLVLALAAVVAVVPVAEPRLRPRAILLAAVIVAQAALGFTQYLLDLPAALVLLHVAGATLLWLLALDVAARTRGGGEPLVAAGRPARVAVPAQPLPSPALTG